MSQSLINDDCAFSSSSFDSENEEEEGDEVEELEQNIEDEEEKAFKLAQVSLMEQISNSQLTEIVGINKVENTEKLVKKMT